MNLNWKSRLALCLGLCCLASVAQAAPPLPALPPQIDPGQVSNENQRAREKLEQQQALPQQPAVVAPAQAAPRVVLPAGPTFLLRGVKLDASKLLKPEELNAITSKYVGARADMARIQQMVQEINRLYSARGFATATAYLPAQEITDGIVEVRFVEGRLGKVTVTGAKALKPEFVRAHVDGTAGEVVDLPRIANELSSFNKTGVARFQALLQPGQQFGMTDIEVAVTEPARNSVQVFYDNQGVSSVGEQEFGVFVQSYAPLGIDDKFTLYAVGAEGNLNGNLAYNVPIDPFGGRAGISLSKGAIRVIDGPYRSLDVRGRSQSAALNFSQPLMADPNWLVLASVSLVESRTTSSQSHVVITSNDTQIATGGLTVGYTGQTYSLTLSPTLSEAVSRSKVSHLRNDFPVVGGSFNGYFQLPHQLALSVNGAWQSAWDQLMPGDQLFQAGGPTTVRGYPANAVAGLSGFFTDSELRRSINYRNVEGNVFVFYDHGEIYNHFPAAQILNSIGAGFAVALNRNISADFTAGFPLKKVVGGAEGQVFYFRLTGKLL